MAVEVNIDTDLANLTRFISDIEQDQLPFAAALGLTRTAQAIQAEARGGLDGRFTIRTGWVKRGVQVNKAAKADSLGKMQAEVGSLDEFMARQELGGQKVAQKAGKSLGIPLAVRKNDEDRTPPSKWPKALLQKKSRRRPFVTTSRHGKTEGQKIIARRHEIKERYPLEVLYVLKEKLPVLPRWDFREVGARTAEAVYFGELNKALDDAVATAVRRHKPRRRL